MYTYMSKYQTRHEKLTTIIFKLITHKDAVPTDTLLFKLCSDSREI